jgi:hypothetical protein
MVSLEVIAGGVVVYRARFCGQLISLFLTSVARLSFTHRDEKAWFVFSV